MATNYVDDSTKLDIFIKQLSSERTPTAPIDSAYLLNEKTYFRQNDDNCKLTECKCLERLCNLLKQYHTSILNSNNHDTFQFKEKFDIVSTINDANHLLFSHSTEFEPIHQIFKEKSNNNQTCDLSKCLMTRRNYRDRSKITSREDLLSQMYSGDDVVTEQILDSVHCHWFHTFDIGYKLTKSETQDIMHDDVKRNDSDDICIDRDLNIQRIHDVVRRKRKCYSDVQGLERLRSGTNKFMMKTQQNKLDEFSYGSRYFYWNHYKNNRKKYDDAHNQSNFKWATADPPIANAGYSVGDWYIDKKYRDLKTELIGNPLCSIATSQWDHFLQRSKAHVNSEYVKSIHCPRKESAAYYEMKEGDLMEQDHLIAMMVYCGCDKLQFIYSSTYRKQNEKESDEEMIQRHTNYYHLGRLLRECCECFGMTKKNPKLYDEITLYQGVDRWFSYSSMFAYIKGPLSTTTCYAVAVNFCAKQGIIVELSLRTLHWSFKKNEGTDCIDRKTCIDMSWISDYTNEQEIFCIGGLNKFYFNTIIEVATNSNYALYIKGIKQMTFCMTKSFRHESCPTTKQEQQIVFRLMAHELSQYYANDQRFPKWEQCPDYVQRVLHSHCASIKEITFYDLKEKHGKIGNSELHNIMLRHSNGWIKLEIISKLFPKVQSISVGMKDTDLLQRSFVYNSMLAFISENKNQRLSLDSVEILIGDIDTTQEQAIVKCLKRYEVEFAKYSWLVYVETKEDIYDVLSIIEETPQAIENLERRVKIIMKLKSIQQYDTEY
eukprot:888355_1